jgi:hypothetical protein
MVVSSGDATVELVERLKENLSSRERRIALRDIVRELIPDLAERLVNIHTEHDLSQLSYEQTFALVDDASAHVCTAAAYGGFWTEDATGRPWVEFFEALGDLSQHIQGQRPTRMESVLPLHLALYHFGVTALASGNLGALGRVLHATQLPLPDYSTLYVSLAQVIYSRWGSGSDYFPDLRLSDFNSSVMSNLIWHSQLSDRIAPFFASRTLAHNTFLLFEGILAMETARITKRERGQDIKRMWVPAGLWIHNRLPITAGRSTAIDYLLAGIEADGDQSPLLLAGIGGSKDEALEVLRAVVSGSARVG